MRDRGVARSEGAKARGWVWTEAPARARAAPCASPPAPPSHTSPPTKHGFRSCGATARVKAGSTRGVGLALAPSARSLSRARRQPPRRVPAAAAHRALRPAGTAASHRRQASFVARHGAAAPDGASRGTSRALAPSPRPPGHPSRRRRAARRGARQQRGARQARRDAPNSLFAAGVGGRGGLLPAPTRYACASTGPDEMHTEILMRSARTCRQQQLGSSISSAARTDRAVR